MFDKKYKQGMKDGAKPFKDIDSETAKEVQKTADELHRENMKMLGVIRDFIDYQNMPDKDKAAFVERLKEMQKQGKKPANFRIRIVWDDAQDKEIAELLSKELKLQHDRTNCVSYKQYTEEAGDVADYMIFMQDPARIAEYPDSGVIYEDEYGCKIIKHKNMIALICTKIKGDDVREKLSEYYNYLREKYHMGTGKNDAAADTVMKNRKNINESGFLNGYSEFMVKLVDKVGNTLENMEEGIGDLADSMTDDLSDGNPLKIARGILKVPALLGGATGGIVAAVAMGAGTFLAGVPSLLPGMASDAQMDDKVIPVAQRRILAIKAYEWIQMKAMVENTKG